jgi:hypothetical protein
VHTPYNKTCNPLGKTKNTDNDKQVSRLCLGALARLSWEERFPLIVKNQVAKAKAPARHKTEATQQENGPITSVPKKENKLAVCVWARWRAYLGKKDFPL